MGKRRRGGPTATKQATFYYTDGTGAFYQTSFLTNTDAVGIGPFMRDLSNAGVLYDVVGARDMTYASEGANVLYPSVTQVAQLVFSDGEGSTAVLSIPAPVASIFLADGVTVNTGNPEIILLIAQVLGSTSVLSAAGNPLTAYVRGARTGKGTP